MRGLGEGRAGEAVSGAGGGVEPGGGRRPWTVRALLGVLGLLGVSALGGGAEMLLWPRGNAYLDPSLLDEVPVLDSFVLPGLVLGGLFGVGSLVAMVAVARRRPAPTALVALEARTGRHWSWAAAAGIGAAFSGWMVVEVALLGGPRTQATANEERSAWVLYGIYGTVAALLVVLSWSPAVRRYLSSAGGAPVAGRPGPMRGDGSGGGDGAPRVPGAEQR